MVSGRYDTLKLIPWWEQEKVAGATVMVVGAGALGNEILKNLALVGVGKIVIVDFDVVEAANLTRSVLFRAEDIGKPKAEVAALRLRDLNPDVKVCTICGDVTTDVGLGVFRAVDAVMVGVDNFAARIFVNRACFKTGVPWVNGGIQEMMGEAHVYVPGNGACYECNLPAEAYHEVKRRISCLLPLEEVEQGKVPTTPTIGSIIGAVQVQEVLKLLHGREVAGGSGIVFNGVTNEFLPVNFALNERCLNHRRLEPVVMLDRCVSTTTFAELLDIAEKELGSEASIELDFDLVQQLSCNCGYLDSSPKRLDRLSAAGLKCPHCGKLMEPQITSSVTKSMAGLLSRTLAEGGIPPFHIVTAKNTAAAIHFQFNADRNEVLSFT